MLKRNNLFDYNWRFHKGGALGAEELSFDDSGWRLIDLPHDWSIEDLPGTNSPFNADAISQVNGGFTTGGTGWYRKTFTIPKELINKEFIIMFEGVYMNSDVWLNGEFLGNHPNGYTSFWFDISGKIRFDKENVLAVKVKNEGENSRWYSGSGIYRHVWLNIVAPVYFEQWGTCITTPQVTHEEAIINIKTALVNKTRKAAAITFVTKIFNSSGEEKAEIKTYKTIDSGSTSEIVGELKLNRPSLWSPDSPELYKAISEIYDSETLVDKVETTFGIRTISFDASRGFLLNGKPMKLKGGCVHHDNGILGSKAYDRAEERRVELLKSNGFNAIRFS
jgi:beta-galactosidase